MLHIIAVNPAVVVDVTATAVFDASGFVFGSATFAVASCLCYFKLFIIPVML